MQAGCDIPKVIYYLLKNIKARLAGCTLTQGVGLVNVNLSHPPKYGMVWNRMVGYGMVWYGMVKYTLI